MFEPQKLRFNFIDLFGAPRRALKVKKIWTHLMGLAVGYPAYLLLTYLAFLSDGNSLSITWDRFGLYPFFSLSSEALSSPAAWILYGLGLLLWLIITLLAGTIVARITYKELKGDPFYTANSGMKFIRRHWRAVLFSPVSLILIIALFLLLAVLMALVGKIPFVGEIVFVGFFPVYLAGSLFVIYSVVVLIVLLLHLPAIVALWEEDALGSSFQAYAITWNQSWRIVVYSAIIAILAIAGMVVYCGALTLGYQFLKWIFGAAWLMGDKIDPILAWAERIVLAGDACPFQILSGLGIPFTFLANGMHPIAATGWEAFIGSLLAILILLMFGSVFAYGMSIISVGQSLSFLTYKLRTDDENLLERKDEEDLEVEAEEQGAESARASTEDDKGEEAQSRGAAQ
ncbi:MAG: hypothetical protein JSW54_06670 [Fidelibacterota bacterium]|nr:MAG: hypothetical protein JSW54_06670 [Candidatus Neomarinimicrobiota bacterium]